jgi:hypothetical protein
VSQRIRKRIEVIFGWTKTIGGVRKSRYRGVERSHAAGQSVVATLNRLRMAKLLVADPPQLARAGGPPGSRCVRPPCSSPKRTRKTPNAAHPAAQRDVQNHKSLKNRRAISNQAVVQQPARSRQSLSTVSPAIPAIY